MNRFAVPGLLAKDVVGRTVTVEAMVSSVTNKVAPWRLLPIGRLANRVTTYYWLIWHAPSDWDDLKLFLPKARAAGIQVRAYLVPPTESPPQYGNQYSEPFRLDYLRWAEEIARLSLEHPNLTAWVIDDFYANHEFFTPAYLRKAQERSRQINPKLRFLPLMYFNEIGPKFLEDYRSVIDGVVVAYLQDRDEIDRIWAILNDEPIASASEMAYPWNTPSHAGDFVMARRPLWIPSHISRSSSTYDPARNTSGSGDWSQQDTP